ncbi:hypothetical protein E5A73_10045 [Sphingomonas gei]|uniref:Uncharacterized protein n=1 Tax=Sphingomonas gei TaxID=1395960 RepID=A0A4S1XA89_9SPHN|nr:hypothetical protein [Sphingomonas gei]TGX53199.1 hypothetical protein E5A73_10045 [Sphingomonas gei]
MRIDASRALGAYAAVMTLTALWLGLSAVAEPAVSFGTIDVQRINVREPDGTLRMVISNHALIPGIIVGKKEYPHPNRPEAGMIFFNDEGIENGGLVFDGGIKDGKPTNGGSLTFDRYMQDQTLQLVSTENGKQRRVGLVITDRPDRPLDVAAGFAIRDLPRAAARDAAVARAGGGRAQRAWLGRTEDDAVALILSDPQGRPRLTLGVGSNGQPSVELLDDSGKIQQRLR